MAAPSGRCGPEIARESAKTRKAFAARLDEMIEMMADQVPELPRKAARARAIAAIATMAGALVLSRVAGSGRILRGNSRRGPRGGAVAHGEGVGEEAAGELSRSRVHSMMVSAIANTSCGIVNPKAFPVRWLRVRLSREGNSTGRSDGFALFNILST